MSSPDELVQARPASDWTRLSRRGFVRVAATGAIAGVVGLSALVEACSPAAPASSGSSASSGSGAAGGKVQLPTFTALTNLPKPDLPGSADGRVPAGYLNYPKNVVKTVATPPGKGGDVNTMIYTSGSPPTPLDQNVAWQQVNKELNVNLKVPVVALSDYNTMIATTMASSNLPDLFLVSVFGAPFDNEIQFLESQCTDLTPFVAGDAIKSYPNLANLPPYGWPGTVFNNKIYAIPQITSNVGHAMLVNQANMDAIGNPQFKNSDDFLSAAKQLTSKSANKYAIIGEVVAPLPGGWFAQIFRAPNNWKVDSNGKFTKDIETDEYKASIAYVRQLWDAGVIHPDSATLTNPQKQDGFLNGRGTFWFNGFSAYQLLWDTAQSSNPPFEVRVLVPFGADGGKGVQHLGNGLFGMTVIKKSSDDRVKELLGVLNYMAAPFGSAEYQLMNYGVEGTDFNFDAKGNPILTKQGTADVAVRWRNALPPPVLFDPTSTTFQKVDQDEQAASFAIGIEDPTVGLFSNTNAAKSGLLNQKLTDGFSAIEFGRADMSTYDQLVADWKANGGDQIRTEFEQAYQAAHK